MPDTGRQRFEVTELVIIYKDSITFWHRRDCRYQRVTRIRQSKKDRQLNDQRKKDKRTNNDLQNKHIKRMIE